MNQANRQPTGTAAHTTLGSRADEPARAVHVRGFVANDAHPLTVLLHEACAEG